MAKFIKEVVREGEYLVGTAAGTRKKKSFKKDDLEKYAETGMKMLSKGLRIPAPRQHTTDAHPALQEESAEPGYENLGYWEHFYVDRDSNGNSALYGVINAPGDVNDDTTPAGKVSRTAKDTSICVHDFEDGTGQKWEEAIWHIALPAHPIEPGQSNFVPMPDDFEVITMSMKVNKPDLGKLLTALSKCGISLPTDTTDDNVLERLYIAVTQKAEGSGSDSSLGSKPNNSKVETHPIMMSLTQKQIDQILEADLIDPETGEKFTAEAFADDGKDADLKESIVVMSNMLNTSFKERYNARIKALVESGRATKEYAEANLIPLVEQLDVKSAIQMGLVKEGEKPQNAVEIALSALEALPAPQTGTKPEQSSADNFWMGNKPNGSTNVPKPQEVAGVTAEEADDLVKSILNS